MHWNRKGVKSPFGVILQNHLGAVLCHMLWDGPAQAGRWEQMTHRGPFQPHPACDSVILWCAHPLCPGQLEESEEVPLNRLTCLLWAWHWAERPQLVQDQKDDENQTVFPGLMSQEAHGEPGSGDRA